MNPRQLSRELREGDTADPTRRRWIIGLPLLGSAMGQIVSLYQTGILLAGTLPKRYIDTAEEPEGGAIEQAVGRS